LLAAGFAFGSPVWSTLSRSLWSHTWMAFWITAAILLVIGVRRTPGRGWKADAAFGLGLGTTLFWAAFCRQHAVISAAAIGVSLMLHDRRVLAFTLLGGGAWAAALGAASLAYFGTAMPPSVYAAGMIDGHDMLNRFAWLMVSPTRGLLVYCPYLLAAIAIVIRFRHRVPDAGLLLPAAIALVGQTMLLASYNGWHANWAYGPRYYCDVLPWFVLIGAMSLAALRHSKRDGHAASFAVLAPPHSPCKSRSLNWESFAWAAALALSFGWGVFVHERGANSKPAWMWNDLARTLGDEGAVKDWRHPQFLAGITFTVNSDGTVAE
jgi:hypothetical protein